MPVVPETLKFPRLGNPPWLGTAVLAYAYWPTGDDVYARRGIDVDA